MTGGVFAMLLSPEARARRARPPAGPSRPLKAPRRPGSAVADGPARPRSGATGGLPAPVFYRPEHRLARHEWNPDIATGATLRIVQVDAPRWWRGRRTANVVSPPSELTSTWPPCDR